MQSTAATVIYYNYLFINQRPICKLNCLVLGKIFRVYFMNTNSHQYVIFKILLLKSTYFFQDISGPIDFNGT